MDVTDTEVRQALAEADKVNGATRLVAAFEGTDIVVMTWGVVWFLGFLWSHWVTVQGGPGGYHALWFLLIAVGAITTVLVDKRRNAPVRSTVGRRIGVFWCALYVYAWIAMLIIGPYVSGSALFATTSGPKVVAAINTIIPMFAYVVMGLWLDERHFVYAGLGLTLLTCVALFLFNAVFFPLMAIAGGGTLFGYGLWMRIQWSAAVRRLEHHANS